MEKFNTSKVAGVDKFIDPLKLTVPLSVSPRFSWKVGWPLGRLKLIVVNEPEVE